MHLLYYIYNITWERELKKHFSLNKKKKIVPRVRHISDKTDA